MLLTRIQLKLAKHLILREKVSRHHKKYEPAIMTNVFSSSRVMPVYLKWKDEIRRVMPAGQNNSFLH